MAKNYADSVKLPNLVPIAHPAVRLSRNGLNIEGLSTTSNQNKSTTNLLNHTVDRRSFIVGLLQNSNTNNNDFNKYNLTRRKQKQTCTNSDELFTMIDEKLTTGYYGVKHLFNTNEVEGRLSKESFKCVLSQLCGYINNETWQKISSKFDLSNGISFAEFITHFDNNQKVKKELINSKNVQLIDISHEVINRDMNKKILLPELSATYCLALLKAKTKENDFDPK
jgi:Ca2+-binding EF-hand superfamily protein